MNSRRMSGVGSTSGGAPAPSAPTGGGAVYPPPGYAPTPVYPDIDAPAVPPITGSSPAKTTNDSSAQDKNAASSDKSKDEKDAASTDQKKDGAEAEEPKKKTWREAVGDVAVGTIEGAGAGAATGLGAAAQNYFNPGAAQTAAAAAQDPVQAALAQAKETAGQQPAGLELIQGVVDKTAFNGNTNFLQKAGKGDGTNAIPGLGMPIIPNLL